MSRRPTLRSLFIAAMLVAVGGTAAAGERLYSWRDSRGDLHYTDNIEQVPEPFRSQFLQAERQRQQRDARSGGEAPAPPHGAVTPRPVPKPTRKTPPAALGPRGGRRDRDEMDRMRWQGEVRKLRRELAAVAQKLAQARTARDNAMRRYRETRVIARRQEADKLSGDIAKLEQEQKRIRTELEVNLPQRARQEGVPPGWLR